MGACKAARRPWQKEWHVQRPYLWPLHTDCCPLSWYSLPKQRHARLFISLPSGNNTFPSVQQPFLHSGPACQADCSLLRLLPSRPQAPVARRSLCQQPVSLRLLLHPRPCLGKRNCPLCTGSQKATICKSLGTTWRPVCLSMVTRERQSSEDL